jgi:16S rRNA (guanine527-N7)-methyltransferase
LVEALEEARRLGFLGEEPLEQQVRHSLGFARALASVAAAPPASWMDLGSGGGLPGLVLAWHWPQSRAVLLDANLRRTDALQGAVTAMDWAGRVRVQRARAEEAGREPEWRGSQQVVVTRSFGPSAVVAECAAPFLEVGGYLVVSEPPARDPAGGHPDRWPALPLADLGLRPLHFSQGEFGYQLLVQAHPCPDRFPRRTGVPAKRPLF